MISIWATAYLPPPHPPLTHQQSTDNKLGLMMGGGEGMGA